MLKNQIKITIILFVSVFFANSAKAYNIKVNIKDYPEHYIFLCRYNGPDYVTIDSIVAKNGIAEFKNKTPLPKGVYFIVLPPQSRFDFLLTENQNITIKTSLTKIIEDLQVIGDEQSIAFNNMQKEIAKINQVRTMLNIELEYYKSNKKDTVVHIQSKIDSINKKQLNLYAETQKKFKETDFLYKILNILKPFVPDSTNTNNSFYRNYINHYLDRVDFSEEDLLNTPEFIFHKLLDDYCYYFFDLRSTKLNEVYPDIDSLVSKTAPDSEYRKYILNYMISKYENPKDLRLEAIFCYLYRKYFMTQKPWWVSDYAYSILKWKISVTQNNVIGEIGKDIILPDINGKMHSLYELKSRYKVVIFWDSECEICTEAVAKLYAEYEKLRAENIEVFAVYTEIEPLEWDHFIIENGLDWINVYDPNKTSKFETDYGTFKTPRLYILNQDNIIITKDFNPAKTYETISRYEQKQNESKDPLQVIFK